MTHAKFFLILILSFTLTNSLSAETRVGNGGIGLRTDSGTVLLDAIERGDYLTVPDEPAYQKFLKPRLEDLLITLPKTAEFLLSIFEKRQNSWTGQLTPRWYKVRAPLLRSGDRGAVPVILTSMREVQVALNTGEEIFIRDDITSEWPLRDVAMLYLHEGLIHALTNNESLLETTDVIRKMGGRLIHSEILQTEPESLALEFLRILKQHQQSPLYEAILADYRALRDVTPTVADPEAFVEECTASHNSEGVAKTYDELLLLSLKSEKPATYELLAAHERRLSGLNSLMTETTQEIEFWEKMSRRGDNTRTKGVARRLAEEKRLFKADIQSAIDRENSEIDEVRGQLAVELVRDRDNCERAFRHFWHMSTIDLSGRNLADVSALAFFTEADHINISNNQIRDLSPLGNITALRSLDASRNKVVDVRFLEQMTQLRSVNLGQNFILSLSGTILPSVVKLQLDKNFLSTPLDFEAPELRYIDLSNNKLTSSDLESLNASAYPTLRGVNVSNNRIEDLFFVQAGWESLHVSGNDIESLLGLPLDSSLVLLDVSETKLTSISGAELPPTLDKFYVAGTSIAMIRLDESFPALSMLDISASQTQLTIDRSDRSIRSLNVSFNPTFDLDVLKHRYFSWLFELDVTGNEMEFGDYKKIWHLFELRQLAVSNVDLEQLKSQILVNLIKPHRSAAIPGEMVSLQIRHTTSPGEL